MEMTLRAKAIGMALFAALVLLGGAGPGKAASAGEINRDVTATLERLYRQIPGTRDLGARAFGILVFPTIIKAGWGIGGEYGEGALRVQGRTVGYFNTVSASIGLQFGAQARSVVMMFMTPEALEGFRRVDGWKVGVDGSVAIITVGAGGSIDSEKVSAPVVGFILDPKGLMYNLTLEGTKISRMHR
jgi:lipid-binding SYLF domain-containing protein